MLRTIGRTIKRPIFQFCKNKQPNTQSNSNTNKQNLNQFQKEYGKAQQNTKIKLKWILLMMGAGLLSGYIYSTQFQYKCQKQCKKQIETTTQKDNTITFGGDWKMYKVDGTILTNKDLLGTNHIVYFGFTRCPDACPTFMFKLTTALKYISQQESSKHLKVIPLFISLDPQYDSPQKIKQFLGNFDSQTIGLYTPMSQSQNLQSMKKQFNVYANKVPMGNSYSIDHSIIGYLMNQKGKFLSLIGSHLSSKQIANQIKQQLINQNKE